MRRESVYTSDFVTAEAAAGNILGSLRKLKVRKLRLLLDGI